MRTHYDTLLHSASDLNAFLGCAHAAALNLRKLRDPVSLPDKAADAEGAALIQDVGHTHEVAYLAHVKEAGNVVEVATFGSLARTRAAATETAMRAGAPVIYQTAFLGAPWHGFADFLRRVETPSALGAWRYEAVDTKLARTAKPSHVLQLGLYSNLINVVQGLGPHAMHIVLGDGKEAEFRTAECRHTLNAAKARSSILSPPAHRARSVSHTQRAACVAGASIARPNGKRPITFTASRASKRARC